MSPTDKAFAEKRREKRFPINSTVLITLADQKQISGVCCNVSGSGLLVRADQSITIGSLVQLDIQEGRIDFHADADVVRVDVVDGQFLLGLQLHKKLPD